MKKLEQLRNLWYKVCDDYVAELSRKWFDGVVDFYWVGNEVGGVVCLNDDWFINMDNVRYCVDNDVSLMEYDLWSQYINNVEEFNLPKVNLKSWHLGCPRVPDEEIEKLRDLKQQIFNETQSIIDKYGNKK